MAAPMALAFLSALLALHLPPQSPAIHCVTDISHEFLFYFDGRFARQYLAGIGGKDAANWETVSKLDLSNANLFVAQQGATPCPWTPDDVVKLEHFVQSGGGLLILGSYQVFPGEKGYHLNSLASAFGASFVPTAQEGPLKADSATWNGPVESYGGNVLQLQNKSAWRVLISDAKGNPVMASREFGSGRVIVASSGLTGHNPDASDPINQKWLPGLLVWLAAGKNVSGLPEPAATKPENDVTVRGLRIQFTDYMRPYANGIAEYYFKCLPVERELTGVEASPGMLLSLELLPTGGGGFSTGATIGLGAFWGNFPAEKYGMAELIGHETTHSWVLPFAEPMWNEGIATYMGIRIAARLGMTKEAEASLNHYLATEKERDPQHTADLAKDNVDGGLRMAKSIFLFDELRKRFGDDAITRYFQTKRLLIKANRGSYNANDAAAIWSRAVGVDLFPWFNSMGVSVDWGGTSISSAGLKQEKTKPASPPPPTLNL